MIVDSSALVAVIFRENGFEPLVEKLVASESTGIGTPTLTEAGMVVAARLQRDPRGLLLRALQEFAIVEVPFGEPHWRQALDAFQRFGHGRHQADLNFGDCLTYAVASLAQEPLLFVDKGFGSTDLVAA